MNLIPKLETIAKEDKNMGILANYLLNYNGDFNDLKIKNICDELYISIASATRLAKKLGFNGFSDLKVELIKERSSNHLFENQYLELSSLKYFEDINMALSKTLSKVDMNYIRQIVNEILKAKKVVFFAAGGSYISLLDFAYKLQRIKIETSLYNDYHMQHVEAINSDSNTFGIGLSYSGLTDEVIKPLKQLNNNKAKTLLITSNSELNNIEYDYILNITHSQNSLRTYSISCRISVLSILDLIYLSIIDTNPKYYNDLLEKNRYLNK